MIANHRDGYKREPGIQVEPAHEGELQSTTAVQIPGYVAGTWTIDPIHGELSLHVMTRDEP